jgi:hypothetical protein
VFSETLLFAEQRLIQTGSKLQWQITLEKKAGLRSSLASAINFITILTKPRPTKFLKVSGRKDG